MAGVVRRNDRKHRLLQGLGLPAATLFIFSACSSAAFLVASVPLVASCSGIAVAKAFSQHFLLRNVMPLVAVQRKRKLLRGRVKAARILNEALRRYLSTVYILGGYCTYLHTTHDSVRVLNIATLHLFIISAKYYFPLASRF